MTDVVPRLELVEPWTEDELVTVLHESAHDLGIAQKTFMTVLRHALSGMKVCETVNTHGPDRLDLGWRRSWRLLEESGAWLVCRVERSYLDLAVSDGFGYNADQSQELIDTSCRHQYRIQVSQSTYTA